MLLKDPPGPLLSMLAHALDPDSKSLSTGRRLKFKNKNQGRSDTIREIHIADTVRGLIKSVGYDAAARKVAKQAGLRDSRQVKKIYSKHKRLLDVDLDDSPSRPQSRRLRLVSSDK
jgi:hypothetical protein